MKDGGQHWQSSADMLQLPKTVSDPGQEATGADIEIQFIPWQQNKRDRVQRKQSPRLITGFRERDGSRDRLEPSVRSSVSRTSSR